MLESILKNKLSIVLGFLYVIIAILTLVRFDGTGDAGDSIHHFLFAKYAPSHPHLFFDHWAKPLYVLLASPFAQFGFLGIKVFNVLIVLITLFVTYSIALKLKMKNSTLIILFLIFTPLYYQLTFSGLTEPLFALVLSLGLLFLLSKQPMLSSILISFLPFVRSEGLIFLGVFGLYFLLNKKWKWLPVLLTGHLVYSIAGYFFHQDLFWVFNKIPYARMSSNYGSGGIFHFSEGLLYVIGTPLYLLFWFGVIAVIWKTIKVKTPTALFIIVLGGTAAFILAHSLFWYLGIFNSMGLKRVLIGIVPLIAILCLQGYNFIKEELLKNRTPLQGVFKFGIILYLLVFPFTTHPGAIDWKKDMNLSKEQEIAVRLAAYVQQKFENLPRIISAHPYLSYILKVDYFDKDKCLQLTQNYKNEIRSGDLLIWENWYAVVEHQLDKNILEQDPRLIKLEDFLIYDGNRNVEFIVYQYK